MTDEARKRWRRKLDHLLAEEAIVSSAVQKFELSEQIAECRVKLRELDDEDRRRELADPHVELPQLSASAEHGFASSLEALLEAVKSEGLVLRAVPLDATGTTQALTGAASDSAPLPDIDLADTLSQQIAKDFAHVRERYLTGARAAAKADLDALLGLPAWPHLAAGLRGRLLRTAALYRLDCGQDTGGVEALAERAAKEDPEGDNQALAAHVALRRQDTQAALSLLESPHSPQARHLKAAILIEQGDAERALAVLANPVDAESSPPNAEPQADSTDDTGNTAETWRLRALAELVLKRLPDAVEAIDAAQALAPDWIGVRGAAAVIDFWRMCTPAALTLAEQPLWPMPFARDLIRADAGATLAKIERTFAAVAEAMPDGSYEQLHWSTWQLIALLADIGRQDEATRLAERLLGKDGRPDAWSLVWSHFFNLDVDRAALKQRLAAVPAEDPKFVLLRGLHFEMCLEDGEAANSLEELKELGPRVEGRGWPEVVLQWRVAALTATGQLDEADATADAVGNERLRLRLRLLVARARDKLEPERYKDAVAALFAVDPGLDVLAEACNAHASAGEWTFVAVHADELLAAIPTPGSLRLLALATFNLGEYQRCLSALDEHRHVYDDDRLPENLALLRVRCQRMLGDVSQAARDARLLFEQAPTAEHLAELLNAQLEGADRGGMLDSLRRMQVIDVADGEFLLQATRIAIQLDRELAISLWRRAVSLSSDAPEFPAQAATLGSNLGLRDEETGPWFQRMAELAVAGKGGTRTLHISEFSDILREQRETNDRLWGLYRQGDLPVHGLIDAISLPLTAHHHDLPSRNRSDPDPLLQAAIPIRHGARPMRSFKSYRDQGCRLVLDMTGLITAQSLGLLDLVERTFAPLLIPRQWHLLLRSEIDRLRPSQPRRSTAVEQVARLIRSEGIDLVNLMAGPIPPANLALLIGERQAREVALVEAMEGRLLTYLPLRGPDLEQYQAVELPPEWRHAVLGPRAMLDRLLVQGVIGQSEHERAISAFPPEPVGAATAIPRGTPLLVSTTLLEQLAERDLLSAVSHYFRLSTPRDEWPDEKERIRQEASAEELIQWIETLIDRIAAGLRSEIYRLVPASNQDGGAEWPHVRCLEHLLARDGKPGDWLWVDDRHLSGYPATGETLIVDVVEVLGLLVEVGAMSRAKRFQWLHRLRTSNYRFIPLEPEEILYWLERSYIHAQALEVPHQLRTMAQYWADCLYQDGALRFRNDPRHRTGESLFFVSSQSAVGQAIRTIWGYHQSDPLRRRLRVDWLLDNLYLGISDIAHLLPDPDPQRDINLVGADLAHLIFGAFQLLIEHGGTPGNRNAKRRLALAKGYLNWISERIVGPRLLADPTVIATTAAHFRESIISAFGKHDDELLRLVGSQMLKLMPSMPSALRKELHKDQSFMQRIGLAEVTVTKVGRRRIAAPDILSAVESAMLGEEPTLCDLDRRGPLSLRLVSEPGDSRPVVELTDEHGLSLGRHYFPYTELLSTSRELRLQALARNPSWWDGTSGNCASVERELAAIPSAELRIRRVEQLAASSAENHYTELEDQWQHDKGMRIDRCLPPPLSAVLNYIRSNGKVAAAQSLSEQCWESLVQSIPASRGLAEPLRRIALLPCPLPDTVHRSIGKLDLETRREVLKNAALGMANPIGQLHLIDLMLSAADSLPEALDLAQEQIGHLCMSDFAHALKLTRALVDLAYRAFGNEAAKTGIEPRRQLLAAWAHATQVTAILLKGGVNPNSLASNLQKWAPFPHRDLYAGGSEPTADLAWPWHVKLADLVFAGLGQILSRQPDLVSRLDLSTLTTRLNALATGSTDRPEDLDFLRDPGLLTDTLGCLWGGDRSVSMLPLIGPNGASYYAPDAFSRRVDGLLSVLGTDPGCLDHWRSLWLTVRHGRLPAQPAERLDYILSGLDIDALVASDHLLLIPVTDLAIRYRSDRDSIAAQIYRWAEGVDSGDQPTAACNGHGGTEATHVFSDYLIGCLHGLATRYPEDPDGEFARLLEGLIRRSRRLATELRVSLINITRRLPFSRHRALRRTLLAAWARSAPTVAEPSQRKTKREQMAGGTSRRKRRKKKGRHAR